MERKYYFKKLLNENTKNFENEFSKDIVFARFINYMEKALLNRKLNFLRHKKYLLEKEIYMSNEEWEILLKEDNHAHSFFDEEIYKDNELKVAVEKLTEKQKEVITLYYYKDQKIKVIAEKMNMNENAIKQLKLRAINKLKDYLEEENEE